MDGNTFYFWFEPRFMEWLQQTFGEVGGLLARFFTMFGEELILIAILGFIYWCWDKEYGKIIGVNIVTGICSSILLKNVVLRKRPYMVHENIECLKPIDNTADASDISAQGYSFPSTHATNSACVYTTLPFMFRHKIFKILAVILPLIVGLSRMMLGMHYPTDVLAGWFLGAVAGIGLTILQKRLKRRWILYLIIFLISAAGIFYCRTEDYFTSLGIMTGLFLSMPFEKSFVDFKNTRNPLFCIMRIAGGFIVYLSLNLLLKLSFSDSFLHSGSMLSFLIRSLRYAVITFVAIGVYPMLFGPFENKLRALWKRRTSNAQSKHS